LIVLVVGADISLGVDTENIRVRPAPLDVANRFFSQEEIAALRMLPATEQHERFFQYWTLKESYIKARGHGLSIPLDKFSMRLSADGGVNFSVASCLDDDPQRWKFWQLRPTADTCAAICAERVEGLGPDLTVRNVIPLESEDDASVTKTSTCASFCEEGVSLRV
jgi:4'-phosphopantetheinyl transferase